MTGKKEKSEKEDCPKEKPCAKSPGIYPDFFILLILILIDSFYS